MSEFTNKTISQVAPNVNSTWLIYVKGSSAVNSDTFTVTGLTTVVGAYLVSSTGTAATCTFATNVITVTNGAALTWSGICWGT